jgi:hypothetical protein
MERHGTSDAIKANFAPEVFTLSWVFALVFTLGEALPEEWQGFGALTAFGQGRGLSRDGGRIGGRFAGGLSEAARAYDQNQGRSTEQIW